MFRRVHPFILILLMVLCVSTASAQNASLSGLVQDPQSRVIAGAAITATGADTGLKRTVTSNGEGLYFVPSLQPGRYIVVVQMQGFQTASRNNVILEVAQNARLDFTLQVGAVEQTVNVEGIPLINTEDASVSTVVNRQFVGNLPLNGRSFQSLIALTPGAVITKPSPGEQGQFSVNGQRANANYFTVDGVSANVGSSPVSGSLGQAGAGSLPGLTTSGGTNSLVSVDALQEFKVLTSTYAPEFGRTPGAQVVILTRSGTNQFHGTAFEYFRNDAMDANEWFSNNRGQKKSPLRQNDFGFVFGGPVLLPRFGGGGQPGYNGRNHTFFFLSYEGLRLRQPVFGVSDVPSLTARQNAPVLLRPFLNAFPLPTGPDKVGTNGLPTGLAEFAAGFSNSATLNATSIRVDQLIGKTTVFGRYNDAPSNSTQRGPTTSSSLNNLTLLDIGTKTLTLGATSVVSSKIINDFRFNYSRNPTTSARKIDNFGGAIVPADSVFFPSFASSQQSSFGFIVGAASLAYFVGKSLQSLQRQMNLIESVSVTGGDHQLKFGVDYRRLSPSLGIFDYSQSAAFLGGIGITADGVPAPPGSVFSGRATQVTIQAQTGPQTAIVKNFSLYGQDTWKVNERLIVTYGLRYEVNPSPTEANGRLPFTLTQVNIPAAFALAPRGTRLYQTTYNNFAPRVGVAYQLLRKPGWELVTRGGFGIFYDLGSGSLINGFAASFPFNASNTLVNQSYPIDDVTAAPPVINAGPPVNGTMYVADPNLKLPYTYQWNLTFEQSLGTNQTIAAAYVAAVGRRLLRQDAFPGTLLTGNTNFTSSARVNITRNTGTSDYHAFQLQFQRRLSKGLQALLEYTWSKSLDIASNDSTQFGPGTVLNPLQDRGPSDFDVRHSAAGAITYDLPHPPIGGFADLILRGWGVDSKLLARSAPPVDVTYLGNFGFGAISLLRPDLIVGVPLYIQGATIAGGRRINPAAFAIPVGRQGTLGRNALRGFPLWQLDFALRRQFKLTERATLQFRAEFFNLFNHPNFANPQSSLGSASTAGVLTSPNSQFGLSTSMLGTSLSSGAVGLTPLYQVGGARSVQFALKLQF